MTSTALLIAAHGDRGGQGCNRGLISHCEYLRSTGVFSVVSGGVLKGEPSLEEAVTSIMASSAERVIVYPLFMADGYFTRKVLPERLQAGGLTLPITWAAPLGADEALPPLTVKRAAETAEKAGYEIPKSRLLIVGHGSKLGRASADATEVFAAKVERLSAFARVETAFLEETPFLAEALSATDTPTIVEGFFSGDGLHAGDDVPEAIAETRAKAAYAGSLGADVRLADIVMKGAGLLQVDL